MKRWLIAVATLGACQPPEQVHAQRVAYLAALQALVNVACPCGVAEMDLRDQGRFLSELLCHPCPMPRERQ